MLSIDIIRRWTTGYNESGCKAVAYETRLHYFLFNLWLDSDEDPCSPKSHSMA